MSLRLPYLVAAAIAVALTLPASAHHGWGDYDSKKELNLTGTVVESNYQNPHATVRLKTADKTWYAWLAPISRMEARGMNKDLIKVGSTVTLIGYPSTSKPDEMRVERIIASGKTAELR